jgi:hypothetical protein
MKESKVILVGVACILAQAATAKAQSVAADQGGITKPTTGIVWQWSEQQGKFVPINLDQVIFEQGGLRTSEVQNPTDRCDAPGN